MPSADPVRGTPRVSPRIIYLVLALGTIFLGLWIHRGDVIRNPDVRDVIGDALWAAMMMWLIGAILPRTGVAARSAAALGICVAVELSQLVHAPAIDSLRRTTLGHLVLGSGFDPRDLLAYSLGVSAAALLDWAAPRRRIHPSPQPRSDKGVWPG